jgi:hypothetical protein
VDVVIEQNGIVGVANHVVWRNRGGERVCCNFLVPRFL